MMKTGELLGIQADALSEKCANFSEIYGKRLMDGLDDRQANIDLALNSFTEDERTLLTLHFLHEKTMDVIKDQIAARFKNARVVKIESNDSGV